ncbi:MAG: HAMP domain-containing histidine kinase [Chitinophagaceae bacterium]|jgi:glucose-6-phosphate-specific signal transduction histidine kinase|nr:HAMP domain-containing histidine kinase [Chitinophagaceae bacterium]
MKESVHCPAEICLNTWVTEWLSEHAAAIQEPAVKVCNHIPASVMVRNNAGGIRHLLGKLLQVVLEHAQGGCVSISAKTYSDVVLVHVRDNNSPDYGAIDEGLQRWKPAARELGGFLDVTSQRKKQTTVAFSFPQSGRLFH